ncbi:MAG TPA: hypothetical protein PLZ93_05980 [Nocardioides sp.]|uniref:hypothetical protein n=1 Tax=uncultured Nocardioides sp. TaxID=198441 RepID=UPI000EDE0393|nr:hypothetical protein [uncultured Nocardioides sp.]HCB06127.1 hypothetical protein [Nocardioides sp.]HRD61504.1 hypothetical protein [Nocardioides sp.]HRI95139.1 hypothetical protein [Nocardioides sp.]HRK45245.1 hypothetical protein [Nocardioides sp.]
MTLGLTLLTPLLAFAGALLGVVLNRWGALELEQRSVREETMRNVRWAAELVMSPDPRLRGLGMGQIQALNQLPALDVYERTMLLAVIDTSELSSVEVEEASR